jgi:hypothetical protein
MKKGSYRVARFIIYLKKSLENPVNLGFKEDEK